MILADRFASDPSPSILALNRNLPQWKRPRLGATLPFQREGRGFSNKGSTSSQSSRQAFRSSSGSFAMDFRLTIPLGRRLVAIDRFRTQAPDEFGIAFVPVEQDLEGGFAEELQVAVSGDGPRVWAFRANPGGFLKFP